MFIYYKCYYVYVKAILKFKDIDDILPFKGKNKCTKIKGKLF